VDKETKTTIVSILLFAAIIGGVVGGVFVYSGLNPPFSTVTSESMQHETGRSQLGVIDTADMVIIKDPNSTTIQTYVDGYKSGYSSFGEYGDVIIYYRLVDGNPIIHRAILWLDNNGDGTWSAPSLEGYDNWYCIGDDGKKIDNHTKLSGKLTLTDVGYGSKTASITFAKLIDSKSGYLTMGDNSETNNGFDQELGITTNLIDESRIKAVAGFEVPWAGWLNIYLDKGYPYLEKKVANSLPCIVITIITIIGVFAALFVLIDFIERKI
jgi:signal peptidase I